MATQEGRQMTWRERTLGGAVAVLFLGQLMFLLLLYQQQEMIGKLVTATAKSAEIDASIIRRLDARLRYCRIETGTIVNGEVERAVLVTSDGGAPPCNAIWFGIGKRMVLPEWYTHGDAAQSIPGNELQEAWEKRTPGVYKMTAPSSGFLAAVAPLGIKVEVDQ